MNEKNEVHRSTGMQFSSNYDSLIAHDETSDEGVDANERNSTKNDICLRWFVAGNDLSRNTLRGTFYSETEEREKLAVVRRQELLVPSLSLSLSISLDRFLSISLVFLSPH